MELDRLRHIGANMAGVLTCEDGTRWHPAELLPLANEVETLRQQLAAFQSAAEHVTEDGCTRRSFVAMPEGWAMVHKDRLAELEVAEERLAASQQALRNVYELWVGVEGIVVWTDEEAHLLQLILQMRDAAKEGLK